MLSSNENMSEKSLLYVIYHKFLTPHLPQAEDFSGDKETALLQCTLDALLEYGTINDNLSKVAKSATAMMQAMLRVHNNLSETIAVDDGELVRMLGRLQETRDAIPLHIREQNAGVLITKAKDALHVESFKLSPTNKSVITTKGRLRRSFPRRAISISLNTAREPGFYNTLTATLAKMSAQPAPHTLPKEKKAGQPQDKNRDTAHPKIVTELLDAFLQAVGRPLDGIRIWKNTREEVLFRSTLVVLSNTSVGYDDETTRNKHIATDEDGCLMLKIAIFIVTFQRPNKCSYGIRNVEGPYDYDPIALHQMHHYDCYLSVLAIDIIIAG